MSMQFIGLARVEDLDAPVVYDMDRMNRSLASGEIRVPKGLSPEERRRFLRENRLNVARSQG